MTIRTAFFGLMLLAFAGAAPADAAPRKSKLLLQDLEARGVDPSVAAALSTSTCMALARTPGLDVLCGDDLRSLMRFGTLAASFRSCEGDACFASVGRALKARFVVSGSVSRLGELFVLSLTAYDTTQAKVIGRTEVKAPSLERLQTQIAEAVSDVLPKPAR